MRTGELVIWGLILAACVPVIIHSQEWLEAVFFGLIGLLAIWNIYEGTK